MNNGKEQISSLQIVFMVMLFEIGSTPLFLLGGDAEQNSWLAMLTGAMAGLVLLLLILWVQSRSPGQDLAAILKIQLGKRAGLLFGFFYALYFAYQSMRNVRDLGEITTMTLLSDTPIWLTMLIFVLIAGYAIFKGAEVIFRLPEVLLPLVILFYILLAVLLMLMGSVDFRRLLPVMENGFKPILETALPEIVSFPFGQMLVFLMLWPLWKEQGTPYKPTLIAYGLISLFLVFMNALNIATLGPSLAAASQLPFLQTVRTLSNLQFIERLDLLVTILLFIGLLIKMMLFYFCAVRMAHRLTGIPDQVCVIPVGLIIYASSFLERDYTQHIAVGLGPSLKLDTIFQIGIPVLLACTILIRSARKKQDGDGAGK